MDVRRRPPLGSVPIQRELCLTSEACCARCGRPWAPVVLRRDDGSVLIEAVLALPLDEREAFSRCWTGQCTKRGA